uniref:Ionotropic glutamate receptor C-terminal domain-containing protein n=1 Tax=Timema poppense TaxID=170557 RepID=A0A7R9D512_TIMPO|nr:unnamed protein product [Timema poppensis]
MSRHVCSNVYFQQDRCFRLFIRQPENYSLQWGNFLAPFSCALWLLRVVFAVVFATLFTILHKLGQRYGSPEVEGPKLTLYEVAFYTYGAFFCSQSTPISPRSISCQLVFLMMQMTTVVLAAAYSAALVSSLSVKNTMTPFNSVQGLLEDETYSLEVTKYSAEYSMFQSANSGLLQRVYQRMQKSQPDKFPSTIEEGLERVCTKNKYAYLTSCEVAMGIFNSLSCGLFVLPEKFFKASLAMATRKENALLDAINYKWVPLGYDYFASLPTPEINRLWIPQPSILNIAPPGRIVQKTNEHSNLQKHTIHNTIVEAHRTSNKGKQLFNQEIWKHCIGQYCENAAPLIFDCNTEDVDASLPIDMIDEQLEDKS